jgi:hypothetical protein
MKIRPLVIVAILGLMWLAGCATVTFKRGAGPGGAKADEDACRATSASQAAYVECLRARGWMVAGKGVGPQPATAAPTKPATPPAAAAAPVAPVAPKPTTSSTAKPATAPATKPAMTAPAAVKPEAAAPEVAHPGAALAPEPTPAEDAPLDPKTRINVSSWWKLGGTAAELDRAMAACEQELGADHKASAGGTEVTVALKDCLRAKKWFAVGGTGPL